MIDVSKLQNGDKVYAKGIIGVNGENNENGWVRYSEPCPFIFEGEYLNGILTLRMFNNPSDKRKYSVTPEQVTDVEKEVCLLSYNLDGFGDTNFHKIGDVGNYFQFKFNIDLEIVSGYGPDCYTIIKRDGISYLLKSEVDKKIEKVIFGTLKIGTKVQNKNTKEYGTISRINQHNNTFDVMILSNIKFSTNQTIDSWDVI